MEYTKGTILIFETVRTIARDKQILTQSTKTKTI